MSDETAAVEPAADAAPAVARRVPVVLTVDDEPSVLSALRRLFRPQGWRLLQATSGAQGLELMAQETPDLILSDMRMPEMNGAQFLERALPLAPHAGRVLLTGYADIGTTIAAINNGEIHRYVSKPWDDQALLLMLRELLEHCALKRQNAELLALTERQNKLLQEANHTLEARVQARTAELGQINAMLEASYQELDESFLLAVKVFSNLLGLREGDALSTAKADPPAATGASAHTHAGHSSRVAQLAQDTAAQLGLGGREQRDVYLGALLHDMGKIGLPDAMLGRAHSTFSVAELARYRRHPVDGEAALMPLTGLRGVARIVREHHERFDGRGFPDGLAGQAICIGARIVAVVSDYDNLLHGVIGELHSSTDKAREWLRVRAGSHYDPDVVAATLKALALNDSRQRPMRRLESQELQPGMVLARDLVSPTGAILLASGYVFDARIIQQIQEFARRQGARLRLDVELEPPTPSVATATPAALTAAAAAVQGGPGLATAGPAA